MGGGGSNSSSAQTDQRLVTGQGSAGVSGNQSSITINTLDQGIVNHAIDLAASTNAVGADTYKALLNTTQQLIGPALDVVKLNTGLASSLAQGAQQLTAQVAGAANPNQPLIIGGLVIAAIFAIKTFGKA